MSKPKSIPIADTQTSGHERRKNPDAQGQEPLSGSKKVKQANHVDHHNPQG